MAPRRLLTALVLLAVVGALGWITHDLSVSYIEYIDFTEALTLPGEQPERSMTEFMRYRKAAKWQSLVGKLVEDQTTSAEVLEVLGEPDHVRLYSEGFSWFYRGDVFRGRRTETVVVSFNNETKRIESLGYISYN